MDMCYLACAYRTPSGYCGSTGGAATCPHRQKKQTNADRIRSMTDEELANWLEQFASCELCPAIRERCGYGDGCINAWLDWLKQEAT